MLDFYTISGGGFGIQSDPILESELKKCKTQEEREQTVMRYQITLLLGCSVTFIVALIICGVFSLLRWACN